jgi:hypothetical protein
MLICRSTALDMRLPLHTKWFLRHAGVFVVDSDASYEQYWIDLARSCSGMMVGADLDKSFCTAGRMRSKKMNMVSDVWTVATERREKSNVTPSSLQ